jgi:hypothetical protein
MNYSYAIDKDLLPEGTVINLYHAQIGVLLTALTQCRLQINGANREDLTAVNGLLDDLQATLRGAIHQYCNLVSDFGEAQAQLGGFPDVDENDGNKIPPVILNQILRWVRGEIKLMPQEALDYIDEMRRKRTTGRTDAN